MAKTKKTAKREILDYEHSDKTRKNNPPVGLVDPDSDPFNGRTNYAYDPYLGPDLNWTGKRRTPLQVSNVSLHVHERIEPTSIIAAARRRETTIRQLRLFESIDEKLPLREAIEFYKHENEWSNRLIAGDSLLVMNSLLQKEGLGGKVQMVYFDPPYGIDYKSNAQPFVNRPNVAVGDKDEDLDHSPEQVKAFRDTWELGIHSYLSFISDRMKLVHELLAPSGSVFVQISDQNLHHVREVLDQIFLPENFVVTIPFKKKGGQKSGLMRPVNDYLIWFAKDKKALEARTRKLFRPLPLDSETAELFRVVQLPSGEEISLRDLSRRSKGGVDYTLRPDRVMVDFPGARLFTSENLTSGGVFRTQSGKFTYKGRDFLPPKGSSWKHSVITDDGSPSGMERLAKAGRLYVGENQLRFKRFLDDFGYEALSNWWDGIGGAKDRIYVVQTNTEVVKRCMLMATDPGELVLDITCGSGTTAYVAEEWGRRWITCDTSRVAIALARTRLMTATFPYYKLRHPDEGISSGLAYKQVSHITSSTIANNDKPINEYLYDDPEVDNSKIRVCGPFTLEAVPAPAVSPLTEGQPQLSADQSLARMGTTSRLGEWLDEMLETGVKARKGDRLQFSRLEPAQGTRWVHATGETRESKAQQIAISFGPEHAPLEQRHVALALEEAKSLVPRPKLVIFCAFQFDPEAAKDIDDAKWPGVTLLKVQMNADLLTEDLKKKRSSNESFLLIGQPDVRLDKKKRVIEVLGFDYYNTKTGAVESGGSDRIAMWLLDPDYDGRSLFPRQVFFPMADPKGGWSRLARDLKAELDEEKIEAFRGTVSLPFEPGKYKRAAVKIVDDRGIESLKIVNLE